MQKTKYLNFEGITISSNDYGEFDKIYNILSESEGVISCIIKRIKKNNNPNYDSIDIFQKMEFKASVRENFWTIYEAKNKYSWFDSPINLAKLSSSNIIAELCIKFNSINENNAYIYHLVNICLSLISKNNILFSLIYFQIKILISEGIFPEINNCLSCNTKLTPDDYYLIFEIGGLSCSKCLTDDTKIKFLESEIRLIKYMSKIELSYNESDQKTIGNVDINLYKKISEYIKYHTTQEIKSEKIFFTSLN